MNNPTLSIAPASANRPVEKSSSMLEGIATGLAILALIAASLAQTACNTTKGVGRDVQTVGRGVERVAEGR